MYKNTHVTKEPKKARDRKDRYSHLSYMQVSKNQKMGFGHFKSEENNTTYNEDQREYLFIK